MKKGLFCAMLVAASLVSGWCFADYWMYCDTNVVANSCTGAKPGKEVGTDIAVTCNQNGNAVYACLYVWYSPFSYCSEDTRCNGVTPNY